MTNSDNPFLHSKKLWKNVYDRVFFLDNDIAEKEQKDPIRNSQCSEQHHENPQASEVASLHEDSIEVQTGFEDVRGNLLYCLSQCTRWNNIITYFPLYFQNSLWLERVDSLVDGRYSKLNLSLVEVLPPVVTSQITFPGIFSLESRIYFLRPIDYFFWRR